MKIAFFLSFIAFTFSMNLLAGLVPSDEDYYVYEQGNFRYIFTKTDEVVIPKVIMHNEWINNLFEKSYGWNLDETTNLVLTSPRNQILNASATVLPNNIMVFYPGGIGAQEYFAESDWLEATLLHENAHLYQLNPKSKPMSWLKKIFGNSIWPLPPWPMFTTPNLFMPRFIVEGNATFNESRFNAGGRLFNPTFLAAMYSRMKAEKADVTYALNSTRNYPFGSEKYILGGMFFSFVAHKYSADKVNKLFVEHAQRWVNPLLLNRSFQRLFGKNFFTLYEEFLTATTELAKQQTNVSGDLLATSVSLSNPKAIGDEVLFITSNGIDSNFLNKLSIKDSKHSQKDANLPNGSVFKYNGKQVVSSSRPYRVNGKIGHYQGLYKSGYKLDKSSIGKKYIHIDDSNKIYFAVNKGFTKSYFYLNNEKYDVSHSDPYVSANNDIYYFKNKWPGKRTLYRNKKPLMSYDGFFGRIVHASKKGEVYYIAASPLGSTLYKYNIKTKQNFRVSSADTLVDAFKLKDKWLFVEVYVDGYKYLLGSESKPEATKPFKIEYEFHQQNEAQQLANLKTQTPAPIDLKNIKPYNSFTEMQFSTLSGYAGAISSEDSNEIDWVGGLFANFVDPTLRNAISLSANKNTEDRYGIVALYANAVYQWNWALLTTFYKDFNVGKTELTDNTEAQLIFMNPWYISGLWSSTLTLGAEYAHTNERLPYNENSAIAEVDLKYSRKFVLADLPQRSFSTKLSSKTGNLYNSYALSVGDIFNLGSETYLIPSLIAGFSEMYKLDIASNYMSPISLGNFSSKTISDKIYAKEIGKASLRLQKPIWWSVYSNRVPIGIKSISPFVEGNYFYYKPEPLNEFKEFSEVIAGAEANLLINHEYEVKLQLFYGTNNLNNNSRFEAKTNFQTTF